jgi:hypothetical protein
VKDLADSVLDVMTTRVTVLPVASVTSTVLVAARQRFGLGVAGEIGILPRRSTELAPIVLERYHGENSATARNHAGGRANCRWMQEEVGCT